MADFQWTKIKEEAAQLIAEGELSDPKIAEKVGVSRQYLWVWRQSSEFAAKVDSILDDIRAALRRRAIASAERRVDRLNRDWLKLQAVIEARAADPELADVPGGNTGHIVHNVKGVGKGDDFQLIDLYEVDTGTLKELREIEKQAAQELGQWVEKSDMTSAGKTLRIVYVNDWRTNRTDNSAPLPTPRTGGGPVPGETV